MEQKIEHKEWNGMKLVRISDVDSQTRGAFTAWLFGQTMPITDDETPMDWAYESDYNRFVNGMQVID